MHRKKLTVKTVKQTVSKFINYPLFGLDKMNTVGRIMFIYSGIFISKLSNFKEYLASSVYNIWIPTCQVLLTAKNAL